MAHKYRMYPDDDTMLWKHANDARAVWNVALESFNLLPRTDFTTWTRQLADARAEFDWLGEGSSSVQQAALRDLHQALKNWWDTPAHFGRPTWRSYRKGHNGFLIRDLTVEKLNRKWGRVKVPKLGWVKFRLSRPLPTGVKSARVTHRAGKWFVSFVAPQPAVEREQTGAVVGLDFGVANTVTTSDGDHLSQPASVSPRLSRLQRKLARQKKGSHRREQTKAKIARLRERERDTRKDWIEKTSTRLVQDYDLIVLEDLKVKNMMSSAAGTVEAPGTNVAQKRGLNRSIAAQGWAMLRQRIEQKAKAATSPVLVVAVNPANTSRRCYACGHTAANNRESQAVFVCRSCGHSDHADVNAAKNILRQGMPWQDVEGSETSPPCEASSLEVVA